MDQATHNKIVSFIWEIADDVLDQVRERLDVAITRLNPLKKCAACAGGV
jgi:hypothetical protein